MAQQSAQQGAQQGASPLLPPPLQRNQTPPDSAAPSPPPSDTAPSDGAPSDGAVATAEEARITVFEDWVHRCTDITLQDQPITQCELLQAQQRPQGDEMLNVLILAFAEIVSEDESQKPAFMLTSVVPLDVFLPDGMRFLADGQEVMHVPFRNCNPNGCWSQIIVEASALNALKKGNVGLARFTIMTGQEVEVQFSLKGLTAGLNALTQG